MLKHVMLLEVYMLEVIKMLCRMLIMTLKNVVNFLALSGNIS